MFFAYMTFKEFWQHQDNRNTIKVQWGRYRVL